MEIRCDYCGGEIDVLAGGQAQCQQCHRLYSLKWLESKITSAGNAQWQPDYRNVDQYQNMGGNNALNNYNSNNNGSNNYNQQNGLAPRNNYAPQPMQQGMAPNDFWANSAQMNGDAVVVDNKKSNNKKVLAIVLIIVAVVVILGASGGGFAYYKMVYQPKKQYDEACDLLKESKYQEALDKFNELDEDYEDVEEKIEDCNVGLKCIDAENLLNEGKYQEAIDAYKNIKDIDTTDKVNECNYKWAKSLLKNKEYKEAKSKFNALGTYSDSKKQVKECDYQLANKYYSDGDTDKAIDIYENIKGYKKATEKLLNAKNKYVQNYLDYRSNHRSAIINSTSEFESMQSTAFQYIKDMKKAGDSRADAPITRLEGNAISVNVTNEGNIDEWYNPYLEFQVTGFGDYAYDNEYGLEPAYHQLTAKIYMPDGTCTSVNLDEMYDGFQKSYETEFNVGEYSEGKGYIYIYLNGRQVAKDSFHVLMMEL